jgi:hypothetical protein
MNESPNRPANDEDPALDGTLKHLERFSPRQGFAERVVARVRVPLPAWARRIRGWFQGTFTGVTGWTVLVTFSLATAAAWGSAAMAGLRYRNEIIGGAALMSDEARESARQAALDLVVLPAVDALAVVESWTASIGLPLKALGLGYAALALVSTVALWRLMSDPGRGRRNINVVR